MISNFSSSSAPAERRSLETILQQTIRPRCAKGHIAILFTGGIDSTTLACITQDLSPELYFAEILDPSCASYNQHSIRHCRDLARRLSLRFHSIPISLKIFQAHLRILQRRRWQHSLDQYLPAADHLFALMKQQSIQTVLSGMGADDVLCSSDKYLKKLLLVKEPISLVQHRRAAAVHQLRFLAPFISPPFIATTLNIPFELRWHKQPLSNILRANTAVYTLMEKRPRQDSFIPDKFFQLKPTSNSPHL